MKKLKTLGFLALEKVGEEFVVHSLKLFKTAKEAKDFVLQQKNNNAVKELLEMVEPLFVMKKLVKRLRLTKKYQDRQILKVKIKKYFNGLDSNYKDFIESFLKETVYFSLPSISISNNCLSFKL